MKVIISFIIGVSITFGAVVLFDYLHSSRVSNGKIG